MHVISSVSVGDEKGGLINLVFSLETTEKAPLKDNF